MALTLELQLRWVWLVQEHRLQLKYPVYTSCVHLDKFIIPSATVTLEIHLSHDQLSVC